MFANSFATERRRLQHFVENIDYVLMRAKFRMNSRPLLIKRRAPGCVSKPNGDRVAHRARPEYQRSVE
jgi:hypothetical protein